MEPHRHLQHTTKDTTFKVRIYETGTRHRLSGKLQNISKAASRDKQTSNGTPHLISFRLRYGTSARRHDQQTTHHHRHHKSQTITAPYNSIAVLYFGHLKYDQNTKFSRFHISQAVPKNLSLYGISHCSKICLVADISPHCRVYRSVKPE